MKMATIKTSGAQKPVYAILIAISAGHLLNDLLQAVTPAIYPKLEAKYHLTFAQSAVMTLCYQLAASNFRPVLGAYTDINPETYSQIFGMLFTIAAIALLSCAPDCEMILVSVILVGTG